ncbi:kinase-like protein [Rhizophagus irregularis]|uniref:Kinase-like protein n=1 Tax=Rhizophagus irregularis TaxID=588596 RepID=A0A2N0R4J1_9GLOM|nr:kinase-like protein [Rhizophagus irregularis]PKC60211.1 kinase-like protein [Rhizophagus irregularis]
MVLLKEISFDPTPKLKSSPIPITFISFDRRKNECIYCGEKYVHTLFTYQKYCRKYLSRYLTGIKDNNLYLDAHYSMNLKCIDHEIRTFKPQVIQHCCGNCLVVLLFKQTFEYIFRYTDLYVNCYNNVIESEKDCKLCGKSLYQGNDDYIMKKIKLCTDCYLISSEYIESPLIKKPIPIIYLPWWHNISSCNACDLDLTFTTDCQKYCRNCLIFYTGCRYCLTTNIIFGLTTQSRCKKCKRVKGLLPSIIPDFTNILSGNHELDNFLLDLRIQVRYDNLKIDKFLDEIKNINKYFVLSEINLTIYSMCKYYKNSQSEKIMEWIPYSQFTNIREIARGGYGIIYHATRTAHFQNSESVILKKFKNSKDTSRYFLNELKSYQYCYEIKHHIIRVHGVTKDFKLGEYMLVMQYASGGDLHNWLQKNFANITWNKEKLMILWQISEGLETIHKADYIHRDFHSGNILYHNNSLQERYKERHQWLIGDLGLSQPVNITSSNNEIYGVIPYIAPEIFKGSSFSKESDVYSMGMIMWELTTGCKPFANVEHDHSLVYRILDGERPKITEDTPECYANLMKSCWDPDPKKRPSVKKIRNSFGSWFFRTLLDDVFTKAELKRRELIESQKLGPEFAKKPHPKAIYTSRSLISFVSKSSSIKSSLFYSNEDYISEEIKFDIKFKSEIYTSSLNVTATSRKRKVDESNIENDGKKRLCD